MFNYQHHGYSQILRVEVRVEIFNMSFLFNLTHPVLPPSKDLTEGSAH